MRLGTLMDARVGRARMDIVLRPQVGQGEVSNAQAAIDKLFQERLAFAHAARMVLPSL